MKQVELCVVTPREVIASRTVIVVILVVAVLVVTGASATAAIAVVTAAAAAGLALARQILDAPGGSQGLRPRSRHGAHVAAESSGR